MITDKSFLLHVRFPGATMPVARQGELDIRTNRTQRVHDHACQLLVFRFTDLIAELYTPASIEPLSCSTRAAPQAELSKSYRA